jgi:hypothetical protein
VTEHLDFSRKDAGDEFDDRQTPCVSQPSIHLTQPRRKRKAGGTSDGKSCCFPQHRVASNDRSARRFTQHRVTQRYDARR